MMCGEFGDDIRSRWERLESEETKLNEEKRKVSQEWVHLERRNVAHQEKRNDFEKKISERLNFLPSNEIIKINVGGQVFSSTVKVWTRDRCSILAKLCTSAPPLQKGESDFYFIDRDWWIFRYIYLFLRDRTLPDTLDDLRELYYEASFYRLGLLRDAIEAKICNSDEYEARKVTPAKKALDDIPLYSRDNNCRNNDHPEFVENSSTFSSPNRNDLNSQQKSPPIINTLPDPFGFTSKASTNHDSLAHLEDSERPMFYDQ